MNANLIDFPKPKAKPDAKPLTDIGQLVSAWCGVYVCNSQIHGQAYADSLMQQTILATAQAWMMQAN
jgi:hypothetical protein